MVSKKLLMICLSLLMLFTSCTSKPSVVLEDTACNAPCWRGISMGMDREAASATIQTFTDISIDQIRSPIDERRFLSEGISWEFKRRMESGGNISFHKSKVAEIDFIYDGGFPISAFINKYGEPKLAYLNKAILDGVMTNIYLIYPDQGICVSISPGFLPSQDPIQYNIKDTSTIKSVHFVDPKVSENQTKAGCLYGMDSEEIGKYVQKWKGFGFYMVYQLN